LQLTVFVMLFLRVFNETGYVVSQQQQQLQQQHLMEIVFMHEIFMVAQSQGKPHGRKHLPPDLLLPAPS